jgi:lipoprotein-anchoring transpeptidase ErfK/SrfK
MSSVRGARSRIAVALLVAVLFGLLVPARAFAATLTVPADVLDRADVRASFTASDPAGLALLYVDGSVERSIATTAGTSTCSFAAVPFAPGRHQLRLVLRSAEGLAEGPVSVLTSWRKPVPPVLMTPSGGYAGKTTPIVVKAGPSTSSLKLTVNGTVIGTKAASAGQIVSFGSVGMGAGINTIVVDATNPVSSTTATFKVRRLDFPWPTCIIVDKSEFKLYWVRDGVVVKTYPVAIGKPSTPTPARNWRIDEKYTYSDWGVYGPRRMRLYKQTGPNSFAYTGYGIHGTNQEWVIGSMASHGCIRMFNADVLELYPQVPLYTMVQTRE